MKDSNYSKIEILNTVDDFNIIRTDYMFVK